MSNNTFRVKSLLISLSQKNYKVIFSMSNVYQKSIMIPSGSSRMARYKILRESCGDKVIHSSGASQKALSKIQTEILEAVLHHLF